MFKKFKKNILIMNVTIITVLLVASFISIYIVTRSNVYNEIGSDFRRISYTWDAVMTNIEEEGYEFNIESFNNYLGITENYDFLESRLANSYLILADSQKSMTKAVGFYDIDYRIFSVIFDEVNWNTEEIQYLAYNDTHFAYRIREGSGGYVIKFMNISKRLGVLTSLIFTSLLIFMITMIFVIIISIYMTNKSIKPLDEAYKRQKQFISDASHELRTPLASINANADLIISKNYIRPTEKKWLDYIKTETLRMSNLTRDLLYMAELDEQVYEARDSGEFDLSYLAETYALGMEAMAFENKLTLLKDINENIRIQGDREKISQLFVILLENAMRYTPEEGTVTIALKKQRNFIELRVSNTGTYIPPEQTKRIFDRFYKIDQSRSGRAQSHGLGLSIAKSIVERHGGSISCVSEVEGLTSFIVKFNNI